MIGNVGAVMAFEWRRALRFPRVGWWCILTAFPVFIVILFRMSALRLPPRPIDMEQWEEEWRQLCTWLLFALIPMLVSMLGTLLWTTPAVSAELERRSWVYLAVRPHGPVAVLLGKYFAGITWVIPPALNTLALALPMTSSGDASRIGWAMVRLIALSAPAYAAVYLLLGVLFPRRAMVVAVAYTLIFELVVSFVPAVINKMTIQYRLRGLTVSWCDLKLPVEFQSEALAFVGNEPVWQHVLILIGMTIFLLIAAVITLRLREFATSMESEV